MGIQLSSQLVWRGLIVRGDRPGSSHHSSRSRVVEFTMQTRVLLPNMAESGAGLAEGASSAAAAAAARASAAGSALASTGREQHSRGRQGGDDHRDSAR